MERNIIVKFNEKVIRKMSKSQFLLKFGKIYPSLDLSAIYDSINPPKKKEKDEEKS